MLHERDTPDPLDELVNIQSFEGPLVQLDCVSEESDRLEPLMLSTGELVTAVSVHGVAVTLNGEHFFRPNPPQSEKLFVKEDLKRYFSVGVNVATIVHDATVAIAASGVTAGVYQLLKTWVDARNGR